MHVLAIILRKETKSLFRVEPLNPAGWHCVTRSSLDQIPSPHMDMHDDAPRGDGMRTDTW
ncbi:hypothetical protein GCM10011410_27830 [Hoyosella rhizosphaerae]|uniref:Uncharacterized protein n=1 Tax=Hoyosella rhizosphaerae TaxID=1755582 RepID=A0A916UJG3_9ACTN|nr:hypothetical protein GCM10011410_27830 [Hoyosella rhizosphaerae]